MFIAISGARGEGGRRTENEMRNDVITDSLIFI